MTRLVVESFGPLRPWVRPGEVAVVEAALSAERPTVADISITLIDLDREVVDTHAPITLGREPAAHRFELTLPEVPRHGYGLRLRLDDGTSTITATSAIEALEGWWESPRHAAITQYRSAQAAAVHIRELAAWHVNVVQHYDWMWRHYRYRPPDGATQFTDALGRAVSHRAVRASIDAGHSAGVASMAYGSVYGAEPEYVDQHPDEQVFDDSGAPLSLGGVFHITDLRPGTPWRERLLGEYVDAIEHFGFDGIHMDTYGPPHSAVAIDGTVVDFASLYPGLIEEAAALVAATAPGSRVLFNCVEGYPLESVAPSPTTALYLELWPPDRSYADAVRWVDRARALADGRQVVIAAYAAPLQDRCAIDDRAAAFEAVPLLGSIIAAAGGYHHTLAEGDRLLVEGYYPAAVSMSEDEIRRLRALWRFTARYVHLLSDPGLTVVEPDGLDLRDTDGRLVPWSAEPEAGSIWVRATRTADGAHVLHLLDLRGQPDRWWDEPKVSPADTDGMRMRWGAAEAIVAASPWTRDGDAQPLERDGGGVWVLPMFRCWLMAVSS